MLSMGFITSHYHTIYEVINRSFPLVLRVHSNSIRGFRNKAKLFLIHKENRKYSSFVSKLWDIKFFGLVPALVSHVKSILFFKANVPSY